MRFLQGKSTRRQHMSVRSLLDRVETSDEHEHLEANLCTVLQSPQCFFSKIVRGGGRHE